MKYTIPSLIAIPVVAGVTYFSINASSGEESTQKSENTKTETVDRVPGAPPSNKYRKIVLNNDYNHTKWGIGKTDDLIFNFAAYTTCFDTEDDDNGDGKPDFLGVPEWVAFEIKHFEGTMPNYKRPSPWMTDDILYGKKMAPNDDTYAVSGTSEMKIVNSNSRFVRGHMCPKNAADRMGEDAGYNTHTVLNAVPQLQLQNNGIWKTLEQNCTDWADKYGSVWVISGPAFFKKNPSMWLGQSGEVMSAIPDAVYKIVIRENPNSETGIECIAFLFPNIIDSKEKVVSDFLTSVDQIEKVTHLTFLTKLPDAKKALEIVKNEGLTAEQKKAVFNQW
ncbi:MAG: DNA/RNA non-specific endonuclease [Fluviicola sp.]|nr:DNA/RNA non-specific endonuclease [Fluviicola sp.]